MRRERNPLNYSLPTIFPKQPHIPHLDNSRAGGKANLITEIGYKQMTNKGKQKTKDPLSQLNLQMTILHFK